MSLTALIAYRGNSSRHFDKKSLKLRFINKSAKPKAVSLAGMSKESEWVLHGPFLDRTLVRNYLSYNIAGEIMTYAPNVRYCELVVDHQYCGLYLAVESIEQGRHRVNIEKVIENLIKRLISLFGIEDTRLSRLLIITYPIRIKQACPL